MGVHEGFLALRVGKRNRGVTNLRIPPMYNEIRLRRASQHRRQSWKLAIRHRGFGSRAPAPLTLGRVGTVYSSRLYAWRSGLPDGGAPLQQAAGVPGTGGGCVPAARRTRDSGRGAQSAAGAIFDSPFRWL